MKYTYEQILEAVQRSFPKVNRIEITDNHYVRCFEEEQEVQQDIFSVLDGVEPEQTNEGFFTNFLPYWEKEIERRMK